MAVHILRALIELEKNGILHNSINLKNILVKGKTGERQYVLGGFENACFVGHGNMLVNKKNATPFSAPEAFIRGYENGYESDIFSLGSVLFYLMSSRKSLPLDFYKKKRPIKLERGSEKFRLIILRAIEYDPKDRYAHAEEMLREIGNLEGTCSDPIIFNRYTYLAKMALLEGKTADASEHAKKGIKKGTDETGKMNKEALACLRVLIYIQMKVQKDHKLIQEEDRTMLKEMADLGDATAQYLYGVYLYDQGHVLESLLYFQKSADNGSEIGGYTYGRMLCKGFKGIPSDIGRGVAYIENAAGKGYVPALRYLSKIYRKYPEHYIPEKGIVKLLTQDFSGYEENKLMYIIPYL